MNSNIEEKKITKFYFFHISEKKYYVIDDNWKLSFIETHISNIINNFLSILTIDNPIYETNTHFYIHAGEVELEDKNGIVIVEIRKDNSINWIKNLTNRFNSLMKLSIQKNKRPDINDYELLLKTSANIISCLSLEQVLQEMLDGAISILNSERGSLMLLNENNELTVKVYKGLKKEIADSLRIKPGEGISGEVAKSGKPILIKDIESHQKFKKKSSKKYKNSSLLSVPLKFGNKVIGVFNINNKKDGGIFNESDLKILMGLANQASIAINNANQFDELIAKQEELDKQIIAYSNLYEEQYALYEIIRVFKSSYNDPEKAIDRMITMAIDTIGASVGIFIVSTEDTYKVEYSSGFRSEDFRPTKLSGKEHIIAMVSEEKCSLIINNFKETIEIAPDSFVIDKIKRDEFLNEIDLLIEEGLKNCVILPLYDYDNNSKLGALLVANRLDGEDFSEHNRNLLEILSGQISTTISQTKLFEQYIVKKNMEKELDVAKSIQTKLLPKKLPELKNVNISAYNKPAKHVSGDYYDFLNHGEDYQKLGLVIADVAGKGIPAALIMSMTRAILRTQVSETSTPEFILNSTNKFLHEDIESNRYVTMFYSIFDVRTYEFTYAKAGHNPPIWYKAKDNSIEFLEVDGFPLGMFDFAEYEDKKIKLESGDKIIYYTDGITEAMNEDNEEYTLERLCEFVKNYSEFDSKSLIERLILDISKFSGNADQHDDLTILVLSASEFHYDKIIMDSTRESIVAITDDLTKKIEKEKIEGIDSFELTMILDELLINAVEHGNKFNKEKKVYIDYSINRYKVELIIRDEGDGFDYEEMFREKEKITLYHKRGRGLQIVKELVDIFEYSNGGRTCRMVKYLR